MMSEEQNSNSKRIEEILGQLTNDQLRFVVARMQSRTDKESAESLNISPSTAYSWPNKEIIDEAIMLIDAEPLLAAREIRKKNLVKAMMIKAKGLDSDDEKLTQSVATEIIEWELGKAKQAVEHTGENGDPIRIVEIIKKSDEPIPD